MMIRNKQAACDTIEWKYRPNIRLLVVDFGLANKDEHK